MTPACFTTDRQAGSLRQIHVRQPALQLLKDTYVESAREHLEMHLELRDKLDQLQEEANEFAQRLDNLEAKVARLDMQYREKKEMVLKTQKSCADEIEELEDAMQRLVVQLNDGELERLHVQYVARAKTSFFLD